MSDHKESLDWNLPQGYEPTEEERALMSQIEKAWHETQELNRELRIRYEITSDAELGAEVIPYDFDTILCEVNSVAAFFQSFIPNITEQCEEMARIATNERESDSELSFNLGLLQKNGINDIDSIRLVLVHEMAHQYLHGRIFHIFPNELWIQELAADLIAGRYSMLFCLHPGKYKYVISSSGPTLSHPDGMLRQEVFEFGRNTVTRNNVGNILNPEKILNILPEFIFKNYSKLNKDWAKTNENN